MIWEPEKLAIEEIKTIAIENQALEKHTKIIRSNDIEININSKCRSNNNSEENIINYRKMLMMKKVK